MLGNRISMGPGLSAPLLSLGELCRCILVPPFHKGRSRRDPPTGKNSSPPEAQLLKTYLNNLHETKLPATLDSYLKQVVTATLESQQKAGCLAVKFEAAYLRSLECRRSDPAASAKDLWPIHKRRRAFTQRRQMSGGLYLPVYRSARPAGWAWLFISIPTPRQVSYFVASDCDSVAVGVDYCSMIPDSATPTSSSCMAAAGISGSIQPPCC